MLGILIILIFLTIQTRLKIFVISVLVSIPYVCIYISLKKVDTQRLSGCVKLKVHKIWECSDGLVCSGSFVYIVWVRFPAVEKIQSLPYAEGVEKKKKKKKERERILNKHCDSH